MANRIKHYFKTILNGLNGEVKYIRGNIKLKSKKFVNI